MKQLSGLSFMALVAGTLIFGGIPPAQAATTITTETVYVVGEGINGFIGASSLAMDASGNPHIAFVDDINFNFMYGTKSGGVWTFEVIGPNGLDPIYGDPNEFMSLAVDASGNPHIAFWDPTPNLLRYASKSGGIWTIETADPVPDNGRVATLALDASGNPHIFYYDQTNLYVKYATKSGGVWTNEIVDSDGILQPSPQALALDAAGHPHVVYRNYYLSALKYATKSGGVWTSEFVPGAQFPASGVSILTSIAADAAGNPHIAYVLPDLASVLVHTTKSGGVWTSESVDPGNRSGRNSIRINPAGIPCISFYDRTIGTNNLKYATRAGGAWTSLVVDAPGNVGNFSWLAFDAAGNAHITYSDASNRSVKYASLESLGGTISGTLLADCPAAGTPLPGITVDAFTVGSGMLAGAAVTNASGSYTFDLLAAGDYNVVPVTPLGYTPTPHEQVVTVANSQTTTLNFALHCDTPSGDVQSVNFWKHQVGVAAKGKGSAAEDAEALCGYLDLIASHFNSNEVNPVVVYMPPASGECDEKLTSAATLLNLNGSAAMRDKARQDLLALLLNVASGRLGTMSVISLDGATVSQAITYCDNLIDSPSGNYAKAKSIAEDINKGKKVAAGMIPLSTAQIAYRQGLSLRTFTVTSNAGPGARTFSFTMGRAGSARLHVFDVAGRLVARLADGPIAEGPHSVSWNGRTGGGDPVGSGIYFARLETADGSRTLKVIQQK